MSVGFLTPLLRALNTPENLLAQSAAYFRIILCGLTASMLYNGCAAVLRAVGDTITPLVFLMFSTILNVGLDLFFVCVLHAGVTGAAVATVLAQVVSGLLCVAYIYKRYPVLHPEKADFRITPWLASQLLGSGLSMGFMMSLVNFGSVLLQGAINTFGEATILAHTAARRLTELFMLPFSVFGTTMATYCSQNWGAKKPGRIRSGMLQSLLICWIWCALVLLVVYTAVPSLVQLVTGTETAEVIETASLYLRIDTLLYFVTAVICVLRNALQGIGDLITPIFSSFLELFGKLAAVLFLTPRLGYMGVILAEPIVWVIMVIPLIVTSVKRLGRLPADASEPCAAEGSPR
ncbi:MAG: polysaccharide biosynthesis C-terminal domain-containing protein [Eubacteriales bacterium]|nr:polysaccharide biosynthesis C-terminal domain-containing protein [Eubacteriales bacterium]